MVRPQINVDLPPPVARPVTGIYPYLRFAVDRGIRVNKILQGTGLDDCVFFSPHLTIPLEKEMRIVRNLMQEFPAPETAWELGRYFYSKAHGVLGGMMDAAPTVGEMLACWIDYAPLLNVWFRLNMASVGNNIRLYAENQYQLPDDLVPFLVERDIFAGKTAVDNRMPGTFSKYTVAISLAHPPRAPRKLYEKHFQVRVRFEQEKNFVEIRQSTLSVPLPDANPREFELFRQQCQAELSLRSESRHFISDRVKMFIQKEKGRITLSEIASRLNMSERALRLKLGREGNSFRKIRNQYIFQQALYLLSMPELTIEEIADTLGYSETCAFTRAFEKWTGLHPGRYRRLAIAKS